jgi:protein MpaA
VGDGRAPRDLSLGCVVRSDSALPLHAPAIVAASPPAHVVVLGRSVQGRPIEAIELGDPASRRKVLIVGCIHGNEPAGIAIARTVAAQPGVDLWVVPVLNPDGVAAGTRQNGHGVDLNRNFPLAWRPIDPPGGTYYSGPHSLSEPESRIAARLIRRLRPRLSIWFHQHLGLVDESGGSVAVEQRFARLVGLPLQRLTRYPGSVTSWENSTLPGTTAFVVELGPGRLSARAVRMYARAVELIVR